MFAVFGEVTSDSLLRRQVIHVTARDSTVILSGSVADAASHERLLAIARAHVGRFALIDSVRVGTQAAQDGAGAPGGAGATALPASLGTASADSTPSDGAVAGSRSAPGR